MANMVVNEAPIPHEALEFEERLSNLIAVLEQAAKHRKNRTRKADIVEIVDVVASASTFVGALIDKGKRREEGSSECRQLLAGLAPGTPEHKKVYTQLMLFETLGRC